jgi:hypothetical protein
MFIHCYFIVKGEKVFEYIPVRYLSIRYKKTVKKNEKAKPFRGKP